ncbi:MAG: hypothetical protein J0H30_01260 [Alphaproteobacteria bacterium]|nr:hypothetical protein [Alphaproteobacteria bacterium]
MKPEIKVTKESSARERLSCTVEDALRAATAMGRVMLTANAQGATHERIGAIEAVSSEGHALRLSGAAHDAAAQPAGQRHRRYPRRPLQPELRRPAGNAGAVLRHLPDTAGDEPRRRHLPLPRLDLCRLARGAQRRAPHL